MEFNVLPSFEWGWTNRGHAILNFHGGNAVAIAPQWFITAAHWTGDKTTNHWANDDRARYYLREKHIIGFDLALIKVDGVFPVYSELRKTPVERNELFTVYGQSHAGSTAIYTSNGVHSGWTTSPLNYHSRLRWGRGRVASNTGFRMDWNFTRDDVELGNGGLNCAVLGTNDSGGGVFTSQQLAGVAVGGGFLQYRTNLMDPVSACRAGYIFNGGGLYDCIGLFQRASSSVAEPIYPQLSRIFDRIAPPVFLNAGGPSVTNLLVWQSLPAEGGVKTFVDDSLEPISFEGVVRQAPASVYKTQLYLEGQPNEAITIVADNLIQYEQYTVRLHFAGLNVADRPGRSRQLLQANDQSALFDPYQGQRAASSHTFYLVRPDDQNRITVAVTPANEFGNATICGVEIQMVRSWPEGGAPVQPVNLSPGLAPVRFQKVVFGAGRFVAIGSPGLFHSVDGRKWERARTAPWLNYSYLFYENGVFVAVATVGGRVAVSQDGLVWTEHQTGIVIPRTATFGGGLFLLTTRVGIGPNVTVQTAVSRDGRTWQLGSIPEVTALNVMTYGGGRFLGAESLESFVTSTDGVNWERFKPQLPPPPDPRCPEQTNCPGPGIEWASVNSLAYGLDRFLMIAGTTRPQVPGQIPDVHFPVARLLTSTDGVQWVGTGTNGPINTSPLHFELGVTVFEGRLYSVSDGSSTTNLTEWTPNAFWGVRDIVRGNGVYLVNHAEELSVGASLDHLERVTALYPHPTLTALASLRGVIVGIDSRPGLPFNLLYSTNQGVHFDFPVVPGDFSGLQQVRALGMTFAAVGQRGQIWHSQDGAHWTASETQETGELHDIALGARGVVAVGEGGLVLHANSIAGPFSRKTTTTGNRLRAVVHAEGMFVAVGDGGTALWSRDAVNWTAAPTSGDEDLFGLAYGGGRFVAVGEGGLIQASEDGLAWRAVRRFPGRTLNYVAHGSGTFMALEANSATTFYSYDGLEWRMVTHGRALAALVGSEGALWQTGADLFLARTIPFTLRMTYAAGSRYLQATAPGFGPYELLRSNSPEGPWEYMTSFTYNFSWFLQDPGGDLPRSYFQIRVPPQN